MGTGVTSANQHALRGAVNFFARSCHAHDALRSWPVPVSSLTLEQLLLLTPEEKTLFSPAGASRGLRQEEQQEHGVPYRAEVQKGKGPQAEDDELTAW